MIKLFMIAASIAAILVVAVFWRRTGAQGTASRQTKHRGKAKASSLMIHPQEATPDSWRG
jgi:hypothetical protein